MIDDDTVKNLENLHRLKTEGVITEADFEQAKARLLTQPTRAPARGRTPTTPFSDDDLPAEDDYLAWIMLPLRRYADFKGRSRRKEYWLFGLLIMLAVVAACIAVAPMGEAAIGAAIVFVVLGSIVPTVAVTVRRFHDQDKSGWFALFNLVPYVGWLIVLIFMLLEGTRGENQYGPDPLDREG